MFRLSFNSENFIACRARRQKQEFKISFRETVHFIEIIDIKNEFDFILELAIVCK